jgi:hypothetical protein
MPDTVPLAGSEIQIHAAHIALFIVWLVVFSAVYARERFKNRARESAVTSDDWLARAFGWPGAIALMSVVAGAIHLSIIGEHFREAALYGFFFLGLTAIQFGFAAWVIWRPSAALLRAGGLAALGVVLLWLATRTTGIPLGPGAGETEPFGWLDGLASASELLTALMCIPAIRALGGLRPRLAAPLPATGG